MEIVEGSINGEAVRKIKGVTKYMKYEMCIPSK